MRLYLLFITLLFTFNSNALKLSQKPKGGDFELKSSKGKVSSKDFRGKLLLIYFGYTFCPDICPTTLSVFGKALKKLNESELEKVQPFMISVDPKRDTFEKLDDYVSFFHKKILALTDSEKNVSLVAKKFGVEYKKHFPEKNDPFYVVDHSTQSFLCDKNGKLVEIIKHGATSDEIYALIKKHLK